MTRKGKSITLSLAEHHKLKLEQLAQDFGMTWGDKPNVSRLLKAIADRKIFLTKNTDWSHDRINTLNQILGHLKDQGELDAAREIAQILLERSEISDPLRYEIQTWLDRPQTNWRKDLDHYIRRQHPFQLTYQDAADRPWQFTVRHATIARHEDRYYLDCWCDETEGNQDIPALQHNWSLRLDRIPEETLISQADGHWHPEMSSVNAEIHLLRGLAFGYRSKTDADITVEWLPGQQAKRVIRQIHNTFWFLREIRRYGCDCVIIGPKSLRERHIHERKQDLKNYLLD